MHCTGKSLLSELNDCPDAYLSDRKFINPDRVITVPMLAHHRLPSASLAPGGILNTLLVSVHTR